MRGCGGWFMAGSLTKRPPGTNRGMGRATDSAHSVDSSPCSHHTRAMELTRLENEMLDGAHGPAKQRAMAGLVQLGRAFGAPRMVEIGYAHIHAGMALYLDDVELMEELADLGAAMAVPASVNIANADTVKDR